MALEALAHGDGIGRISVQIVDDDRLTMSNHVAQVDIL